MIRPDKLLFRFYLLRGYRRMGAAIFQKARIQLLLLLVSAMLMPSFVIHSYSMHGRVDLGLTISLSLGFAFVAALTFVLRSGRYLLSGHLYLVMVFLLIWREMFFGFASAPLTRLDTIVLLLAVLPMAPLLTNKTGLALHFLANFSVLILFIAVTPEAKAMQPGELDAYAVDALVAMAAAGITAYLLTRTGERARRRIENTNANLEEKVRLRTGALRRAGEELKASRDSMHRDMEMARHVQQSMLRIEPPRTADWDIAYYYRPMAQVSGDFHDFHVQGDKLLGAGLFDVSGHGIASGLLTILARSIIMRAFQHGDSPDVVLRRANDELIVNMSHTFNYISGLLFRFHDDALEFANAGHPDPLLKSRAGVAEVIQPETHGLERGGLLGLESLRGNFPVMRREINSGDALLLYSDGIVEAETLDLETYGLERLMAGMNRARGSAHERLRSMLMEHSLFMNHQPVGDDVTLILLIRK